LARIDEVETFLGVEAANRESLFIVAPQVALDEIAKQSSVQILERSPVAPRRIETLRVSFARIQRQESIARTSKGQASCADAERVGGSNR